MYANWNPFGELDLLRQGIDDLFANIWPTGYGRRSVFLPGQSARGYPLLNIATRDDKVVVNAFAPGLDPKTLEVSVERNVLTIAGEKKPLAGVKPEQYHRNERATGKFIRKLHLDMEVDEDKVQANYENGILAVELPKSEAALPRKIDVQVK